MPAEDTGEPVRAMLLIGNKGSMCTRSRIEAVEPDLDMPAVNNGSSKHAKHLTNRLDPGRK